MDREKDIELLTKAEPVAYELKQLQDKIEKINTIKMWVRLGALIVAIIGLINSIATAASWGRTYGAFWVGLLAFFIAFIVIEGAIVAIFFVVTHYLNSNNNKIQAEVDKKKSDYLEENFFPEEYLDFDAINYMRGLLISERAEGLKGAYEMYKLDVKRHNGASALRESYEEKIQVLRKKEKKIKRENLKEEIRMEVATQTKKDYNKELDKTMDMIDKL